MGRRLCANRCRIPGGPVTSYGGKHLVSIGHYESAQCLCYRWCGCLGCLVRLCRKIECLDLGIPNPVISGISFHYCSRCVIAASGMKILIDNKINFDRKKVLIIASVILVIGIGGLVFTVGTFTLSAMALATVLGII